MTRTDLRPAVPNSLLATDITLQNPSQFHSLQDGCHLVPGMQHCHQAVSSLQQIHNRSSLQQIPNRKKHTIGHPYNKYTIGHPYNKYTIGHPYNIYTIGHHYNKYPIGHPYNKYTIGHPYNKYTIGHPYNKYTIGHHYNKYTIGHPYNKYTIGHPYNKYTIGHPYNKYTIGHHYNKYTIGHHHKKDTIDCPYNKHDIVSLQKHTSNREGRKEMFYLTTHSTHFILRLYGIRHMVMDHSDSEKGNPLHHMGYSFWWTARVLLYTPSHRQDSTYHRLCYTSRGELTGTRNSSMGLPHEGSIWQPMAPSQAIECLKYNISYYIGYNITNILE